MKEKQNEQTEKVYCDNESSHTPHSDTRPGKKKIRKERWRGSGRNTYTIATVSEFICFSEENCAEFSGQTVQGLTALAALQEDLCRIPTSLW